MIVEEVHGSVTPETMGADVYTSAEGDAEDGVGASAGASVGASAGESAGAGEASAARGTEPYVLPEPEAQNEPELQKSPAGTTVAGGNATAGRDYPVTNMKPGGTYAIGEGETLYGICFKLYGNLNYLNDIRALNHLDDADRILAGQELILPDLGESGQ